jgi:hypothetical protein
MDWYPSNSLGIQHVFPGGAIGLGSDKALLEIARNTLEVLNRWEDYNAFPTFYTAAARLGYDSHIILQHLYEELRKHAYDNMYIYYGGVGDITIYSEKGRRCVFQNPFKKCVVYNAADKTPVKTDENGDICSFDTRAGNCYILSGCEYRG